MADTSKSQRYIIASHSTPAVEWEENGETYRVYVGRVELSDGSTAYWAGSPMGDDPDDVRTSTFSAALQAAYEWAQSDAEKRPVDPKDLA